MSTEEFYEKVWHRVLVGICGAAFNCENEECIEREKQYFLNAMLDANTVEYRFCGRLGFGGKIFRMGGFLRVSCYEEDRTKERNDIIEHANKLLEKMLENK